MNELKLLPCPFCGNKRTPEAISMAELDSVEDNEWYDTHFTVVCSMYDGGCGASIACNYSSKEDAAEAWNRRADNG